ncbi:MAG TPA: DUF4019 domain-containing protein [Allosphingosinicella sp.]|nr:DUF4019 domain-containing protein [Allosphingosinicella sp.]
MPILTVLLLAATPPAPAISRQKIGEKRYRIVLTAPGLTLEQGQRIANEEAAKLCGGSPVTLGHYRWRSDEKLDSSAGTRTAVGLTLEQEADCAAKPAPVLPRPTGWTPGPADVKTIMDLTARYFEGRDSGRYRDAWNLLTPSMQEMNPLPRWQAAHKAFNDRAGGGLRRGPVKVSWYDNPVNAPVAGIFAAVDFVGKADKLQIICGYLMWLRQPDGSWRLTREEEGSIEDRPGVKSGAEQLAQAKAAMGCTEPG